MLQVINNIKDLKSLKVDLDAIYNEYVNLSFYSPDYIISAYDLFLKKDKKNILFFIINRVKGVITHYIPWYIDGNKTLRFVFDKHTDYCAAIGAEMNFLMIKELSQVILSNKDIKRVELENLLPGDPLLNSLKHFFGLGTIISCYNNHSFVSSLSNEDFYHHLKSNQKSELKRVQRKNSLLNFEVFDFTKEFPKNELIALRTQMILSKIRATDFFNDCFIDLCLFLYKIGELEIFTKSDEGKLVSASVVLKNKHYRMVWIDLYADVQLINLSAYVDYIDHLRGSSPLLLSFGRGSYDYKAKNFQPDLQNLYNLRYSKSKFDFFFSHYQGIKQFVKRLVRERK